jgi:signal transduction histidine kinase
MEFPHTIGFITAALSLYVALLTQRLSRAPGWADQKYFSLIALSAGLYTLCGALPDSIVLEATRLQMFAGGLHVAAWVRFGAASLGRPATRVEVGNMAAGVAAALGSLVPGAYFTGLVTPHTVAAAGLQYSDTEPTPLGLLAIALYCGTLMVTCCRFVAAWRRGVPHAGIHAVGLSVLGVTAVNDGVVGSLGLNLPFLVDLGFLFPVAAVGYTLTGRFIEGARRLDASRARLEATVADRTQLLTRTQGALHRAEKLGAIGQLAAGVAHEINNPAAAVLANLTYLEDCAQRGDPFPGDGLDCLKESATSVDRIARVTRQLLDAGRLAGDASTSTRSVSLASVVASALRLAQARCGDRVTLVNGVTEDLFALGQEQALVQVLVNLIVNAAQAVPSGRADGRVELTLARQGERVEVRVTDNGGGMSEETLRRLFEPFFSTKSFGQGAGLGLAVSRGLVAGLGGELRLTSVLGQGSTATVELARGTAVPPPRAAGADASGPIVKAGVVS